MHWGIVGSSRSWQAAAVDGKAGCFETLVVTVHYVPNQQDDYPLHRNINFDLIASMESQQVPCYAEYFLTSIGRYRPDQQLGPGCLNNETTMTPVYDYPIGTAPRSF